MGDGQRWCWGALGFSDGDLGFRLDHGCLSLATLT